MPKKIAIEVKEAAIATLRRTHNCSLAAKLHQVSNTTAWLWARQANIDVLPRGGQPIPDTKRKAIIAEYRQTINGELVAEHHGVNANTVLRYARAAQLPVKMGKRPRRESPSL